MYTENMINNSFRGIIWEQRLNYKPGDLSEVNTWFYNK